MPPILELRNIAKTYPGADRKAVDAISLVVHKGEILSLVGESGSGKTTLLRIIAGLEHPDEGSLILSGEVITEGKKAVPPHRRNIGMVFQDYALFPHMTIAENVGFGLKNKSASEKKSIILDTLALTGLDEDYLSRYPHQLSGGQQQRVALARALAPKPNILLLDEPFSNLDTVLHDRIREDLYKILKATGITTILVTHHTRDALSMADQVAVIHQGKLLQADSPKAIYCSPSSGYVANLFGKFSCIPYKAIQEGYQTPFGLIRTSFQPVSTQENWLFFRPEQVKIYAENQLVPDVLEGVVDSTVFLGDYFRIVLKPRQGHPPCPLIIHGDVAYSPGEIIRFSIQGVKAVNFGNA